MIQKPSEIFQNRHPELVSGHTSPFSQAVIGARQTTEGKQVHHDELKHKSLLFRGGVGVGAVVCSALFRWPPPSIPPLKGREVL